MTNEHFTQNGLLPRMPDAELDWTKPDFGASDDVADDVAGWASDIGDLGHIVWPAARSGVLVPPPATHVLDHLVRDRLGGSSPEIDAQLMVHPVAGTVAVVSELPGCDMCTKEGSICAARYDSRMADRSSGMAFLCNVHYELHGTGRLGVAEGQYLMTIAEVPDEVTAALSEAMDYWDNYAL